MKTQHYYGADKFNNAYGFFNRNDYWNAIGNHLTYVLDNKPHTIYYEMYLRQGFVQMVYFNDTFDHLTGHYLVKERIHELGADTVVFAYRQPDLAISDSILYRQHCRLCAAACKQSYARMPYVINLDPVF